MARDSFDARSFEQFVKEFASESDRAAVILGAAKLDALLYQLLAKVLVPCPTSNDELLDGDAPLATFSAKINLGYRLGLIDAAFARGLHLCRRIRNSFAHETATSTLAVHGDRVRELVALFHGNRKAFSAFYRAFFKEQTGVGVDFRCVLGIMVVRLERAIMDCHPVPTDVAVPLLPPPIQEPPEPRQMELPESPEPK